MREWLVGGGVIEGDALSPADPALSEGRRLLLVRNLRRNGTADWTPPGGVVDPGEVLLAGLTREVTEETGLVVSQWDGPVYEIHAEAPGLGWRLRVEVHRAVQVAGALAVGADPDGIVVGAEWVRVDACEARLAEAHPWVREPLLEWIDSPWEGTRTFTYRVEGDHPDRLSVERR